MSSVPSFERFDYLLRTNKHIERRLVFDVLASARNKLALEVGWYLGFGSMWFGDFRIAHRQLRIDRLVSIEHAGHAKRAMFNRPFSGVSVEPGTSGEVLPKIAAEFWEAPVIAWLDYDGYINESVVSDIDYLLNRAAVNSVVLFTVNAARRTYRPRTGEAPKARSETAVGVVEGFLGRAVTPTRFDPVQNSAGVFTEPPEADFPEYLCEAAMAYMSHKIATSGRQFDGRAVSFTPLFKLHHRDGVDMITVGGALTTDVESESWTSALSGIPIISTVGGDPIYCRLDLIPFTVKEKIALDECLPGSGDDNQLIADARNAGVEIEGDSIKAYRKFYRYFPVFVESGL